MSALSFFKEVGGWLSLELISSAELDTPLFQSLLLTNIMSNRLLFTLFYTFLTQALAAPSIGRDLTRIQESKTTLPITTRINTLAGTVLNKDQAHIKSLLKRTRRGKGGSDELSQIDEGDSVAVTNRAVYYTANVGIGSPPRTYTLALDTGSSINWVKNDESFQ